MWLARHTRAVFARTMDLLCAGLLLGISAECHGTVHSDPAPKTLREQTVTVKAKSGAEATFAAVTIPASLNITTELTGTAPSVCVSSLTSSYGFSDSRISNKERNCPPDKSKGSS